MGPFGLSEVSSCGWLRAGLAGVYVTLSVLMFRQEPRMKAHGGSGIVGLEMAGSTDRVDRIIERWGEDGAAAARRSLAIDYGVLASYSPLMAIGCTAAARSLHERGDHGLARLGPLLSYGQLAAGVCDAAENTALLAVLAGRRAALPMLARRSAQAKFLLLGAGAAYSAIGVLRGWRRPSPGTLRPQ